MMNANPYETERLLSEYLLFHYGRDEDILPYSFGPISALGFAQRLVTDCFDLAALSPDAQALDLGCAVGRSAFELARHCCTVVGVDFSASFIRAANALRAQGSHPYRRIDQGRLSTACVAEVPAGIERERVQFEVGDACALRSDLGTFDAVLLANLLDRLPDPQQCLARLPALVKSGGQLVIASPFTWLEEYTPVEHWLGGFERAGHPVDSFTTLQAVLAPNFELEREFDLPFLIREHERKFQWSVSHAARWRRL